VLFGAGVAPWLFGYAGPLYGVTALIAGAIMLALAWRVRSERDESGAAAKQLFGFSILYLFLLFAVLLVAHELGA
jgi:protoheme IX farnesyltransferase